MLEELHRVILNEDKKKPLTDAEIAKKLGVRREQIIQLRSQAEIEDSRERRNKSIYEDAKKILLRNENISERKFAALLNDAGYHISRYIAASIKNALLLEVTNKENVKKTNNTEKKCKEPFQNIIGYDTGLQVQINQAKAAILYPPNGLNTLIIGPSGAGKSYLAENMYQFAKQEGILPLEAAFIVFNCADYADNPQLLLAQLFGYVKGAFSGAISAKTGLVEKADGGILFLDEVHRLPNEGQEILFSILDKNEFRRLGETKETKVNVRIIAATTENLESSLLLTFRRRMPMIIDVPTLSERSLKERYALICKFFRNEALQTKRAIKVDSRVMEYLLLYKCLGNVGQLLSDIRVACANAFLVSVSHEKEEIVIRAGDLPKYEIIRNIADKKLVAVKKYTGKSLLITKDSIIDSEQDEIIHKWTFETIYNVIEDDASALRNSGVDEKEINEILQRRLKDKLKEYIAPEKELNEVMHSLASIVDKKIVEAVSHAIDLAQTYIPALEKRVYYFLSIHVSTLYERVVKGVYKKFSLDLENTKQRYQTEYKVAEIITKDIEKRLGMHFPKDEIGMIAMYLRAFSRSDLPVEDHVKVLVLSHGRVASAMTEVANRLLGMDYAIGIDMDFNESPEEMLEKVTQVVEKVDEGLGCLLLVDIGSLTSFDEAITKRTGIKTICIDRVDTAMVLEAVRRANLSDVSIEDIAAALKDDKFSMEIERPVESQISLAILFICLTGEGSAQRLKSYTKEHIPIAEDNKISFFTVGAFNEQQMRNQIRIIQRKYRIIASVGTLNPAIRQCPFISASELFHEDGIVCLKNIIEEGLQKEVSLKDIIEPEYIVCQLDLSDKTQVIDKLSGLLLEREAVESQFLLSAYKRESTGATYLKGGIGLPHGDSGYVKRSAVAVASLVQPILWENNFMVDLVFLFAIKENDQRYISEIYRVISNQNALGALKSADSAEKMRAVLCNKQI